MAIDESLISWSEIEHDFHSDGILLGNGFSCAVWEKFNYPSLYEKACSNDMEHPLLEADQILFQSIDNTKNFERVLADLATAKRINRILGQDYSVLEARYTSIKSALVEAVKQVHIPWRIIENREVLSSIRTELLKYEFVYTTNYDLLIYWAVNKNPEGFRDYFFNSSGKLFDIADTEVRERPGTSLTRLLYLHGGLHLEQKLSGGTIKRKNENGINLLDSFGNSSNNDEETVPLFVAEGESKDKLEAIKRSDYLSFAYGQFAKHQGSLVIFGHGLGESDRHILNAIRKAKLPKIAISIRKNNSPEQIMRRKAELHDQIPGVELFFFDAQTHPLGSQNLKVEVD